MKSTDVTKERLFDLYRFSASIDLPPVVSQRNGGPVSLVVGEHARQALELSPLASMHSLNPTSRTRTRPFLVWGTTALQPTIMPFKVQHHFPLTRRASPVSLSSASVLPLARPSHFWISKNHLRRFGQSLAP